MDTRNQICTPLTSPRWTWVLPDFSTLSFLVSGATADLVPQFAVPSAVKRQKKQCQSTLNCEITLEGLPPCSLSVPAHLGGCQGQAGCGEGGLALGHSAGAALSSERGTGLCSLCTHPVPLCSSQCVSLVLGSHPGGSKQTGLRES